MELLEYWRVIRKRLWLLLLLALIGGGSAFYYAHQRIPQYRSSTTLFLNPAADNPLLPFAIESRNRVETLANTYAEFMRTRSFAELVSAESSIPVSERELRQWLSTEYVGDTQFFRITATHPDPQTAESLANSAAEVLIAENTSRQQAQQQISAQRQQDQELTAVQQSLQDELTYYNDQIKSLRSELLDLQGAAQSSESDRRADRLRDELRNIESLRVQVMTSLAQTRATLAAGNADTGNVDTAVVVDAAQVATAPLPQRTLEITLLGIVLGLAIALAVALLLEYIDFTVKNPEALEALYGSPAQGVIGSVPLRARESPLVALRHPSSPTAETFRALRTNLQVAALDKPIRSLLITSAVPGEGKSFVAANLAVSLAKNGQRVILVDADLRKPVLHQTFGLRREQGLTDIVINPNADITTFLQRTEVKNLLLLSCGAIPSNPAELLNSRRAVEVMEQLKDHADVVIYDSPPAATVTDALALAQRVEGVLQVVGAGSTRINLVRRCKAVLEQVNAPILGPVLNQVSATELQHYNYYYYGYYGSDRSSQSPTGLKRLFPQREKGDKAAEPKTSSEAS